MSLSNNIKHEFRRRTASYHMDVSLHTQLLFRKPEYTQFWNQVPEWSNLWHTLRSFSDMLTANKSNSDKLQQPLYLKFSLHTNISSLACTSIFTSFAHSCSSSRPKSFMQYFCASITAPLRVQAYVLQCFCMVSFLTSSSEEYFFTPLRW